MDRGQMNREFADVCQLTSQVLDRAPNGQAVAVSVEEGRFHVKLILLENELVIAGTEVRSTRGQVGGAINRLLRLHKGTKDPLIFLLQKSHEGQRWILVDKAVKPRHVKILSGEFVSF